MAASFTREQITSFREAFGEAEAAGLGREAFYVAVRRCLELMALVSEPQQDYLASEYLRLNRMSGTGVMTWQQFFQVWSPWRGGGREGEWDRGWEVKVCAERVAHVHFR